jgi:hypothetical protein
LFEQISEAQPVNSASGSPLSFVGHAAKDRLSPGEVMRNVPGTAKSTMRAATSADAEVDAAACRQDHLGGDSLAGNNAASENHLKEPSCLKSLAKSGDVCSERWPS